MHCDTARRKGLMTTIFANVLNIRVTPGELVLEVGSFFPDRPNVGPPSDYKPEIRIVLNKAVLPNLADGLTKAATALAQAEAAIKASQTAAATHEQPKRTVGFAG